MRSLAGVVVLGCLAGSVARADAPYVLPPAVELVPRLGSRPPAPAHAGEPATRAARAVVDTLGLVRGSLRDTRYQHATLVSPRRGIFRWDCSGMTSWILERAAPRAFGALGRARPVARDYVSVIERAPIGRARSGWERLARIEEVRPGDVFAWRRPPSWPRGVTGHVGFLLETPWPVAAWPGFFAARIADATSFGHEDDTRPHGSAGGYGEGILVWRTNEAGVADAYGWFGRRSEAVVVTPTVFGRVH